jgi:hypothetical protein
MVIVKAASALRFDTVRTSVPLLPDRVNAPVALTPFDCGIVVVVVVVVVEVDVVVVVEVVVEVGGDVVVDDGVALAPAHASGVPYWTGVAPIGAAIMTFPESIDIAK